MRAVRVRDPRDEASEMGPLISAEQRDRVAAYVLDDTDVAFRGSAPAGPGFWFAPTVVTPKDHTAPVFREEVFGPVVAVVPFWDEADAIRIANDTDYGLSGSILRAASACFWASSIVEAESQLKSQAWRME